MFPWKYRNYTNCRLILTTRNSASNHLSRYQVACNYIFIIVINICLKATVNINPEIRTRYLDRNKELQLRADMAKSSALGTESTNHKVATSKNDRQISRWSQNKRSGWVKARTCRVTESFEACCTIPRKGGRRTFMSNQCLVKRRDKPGYTHGICRLSFPSCSLILSFWQTRRSKCCLWLIPPREKTMYTAWWAVWVEVHNHTKTRIIYIRLFEREWHEPQKNQRTFPPRNLE